MDRKDIDIALTKEEFIWLVKTCKVNTYEMKFLINMINKPIDTLKPKQKEFLKKITNMADLMIKANNLIN